MQGSIQKNYGGAQEQAQYGIFFSFSGYWLTP